MPSILKWTLALVLCSFAAAQQAPKPAPQSSQAAAAAAASTVPTVDAEIGECTADFRVVDMTEKPIYNAKIDVRIKWGFGGFHKTDLQVSTNIDGKARFIGLPERAKNPLAFNVQSGDRKNVVLVDPIQNCHGTYTAILTAPQPKPAPGK